MNSHRNQLSYINSIITGATLVAYYFVLTFNYHYVISPRFTFLGFIASPTPSEYFLQDVLLITLPLLFLPKKVTRVSDAGTLLIFLIAYVPIIVMLTAATGAPPFDIQILKWISLVGMWTISATPRLVSYISLPKLPDFSLPPGVFLPLLFLAIIASVLGMGLYFGFSIKLHAMKDIYSQRDEFRETADGSRIPAFLFGFLQMVGTPILVALGLRTRNVIYIASGVFISLYMYTVNGSKSALISVAYCTVLFVATKYFRKSFLLSATVFCLIISSLGWLLSDTPGLDIINDLFVRRILLMQGLAYFYYYEAFQDIGPLYLRQSFFSFLGPSPVEYPELYVGELYLAPGAHANSHCFSDGYLNGGLLGIVVSCFICGLLLTMFDRLSKKLDLLFAVTALAMLFEMFTQTGLTKVMGTHGGVWMAFCIYFCPFTSAYFDGYESHLDDDELLHN